MCTWSCHPSLPSRFGRAPGTPAGSNLFPQPKLPILTLTPAPVCLSGVAGATQAANAPAAPRPYSAHKLQPRRLRWSTAADEMTVAVTNGGEACRLRRFERPARAAWLPLIVR
jgi:hypothetical protein